MLILNLFYGDQDVPMRGASVDSPRSSHPSDNVPITSNSALFSVSNTDCHRSNVLGVCSATEDGIGLTFADSVVFSRRR